MLANIENIRKNHISLSVKLLRLRRLILARFVHGFSRYKPHFSRIKGTFNSLKSCL